MANTVRKNTVLQTMPSNRIHAHSCSTHTPLGCTRVDSRMRITHSGCRCVEQAHAQDALRSERMRTMHVFCRRMRGSHMAPMVAHNKSLRSTHLGCPCMGHTHAHAHPSYYNGATGGAQLRSGAG